MVNIVLENCEEFMIPRKYVRKFKVRNKRIKSLWIDKSFLDVCKDCTCGFTWERTLEDVQNRVVYMRDITSVVEYTKKKHYLVNYIDEYNNALGTDNVLQTIEITPTMIKIEWDINPKNYCYGRDWVDKLHIHNKYKGLVENYEKIEYFK